jgi:chlorite dismutase
MTEAAHPHVQEAPPISGDEPKGYPYCIYAAYSAARGEHRLPESQREVIAAEADAALRSVDGVHLRGTYNLAGMRAEADIMFWLIGKTPEGLQEAIVKLQHTALGRSLTPWWTNMGVHREAEFNRTHVPGFFAGEDPQRWLCVYPFVRSFEWYLLAPGERSAMLREHGMMAAGYADVRGQTTMGFALGDYEWLLAFDCDNLDRIVDVMRDLRAATARRHVREEIPFLTGQRMPMADAVQALP